uniref:alpha-glucosidase n=1 Tax=Corethrella appendiculata TaxID=1370023 RepID=U5EQW4_9DIPT
MDESNRNSTKLDIERRQSSTDKDKELFKESYKALPESDSFEKKDSCKQSTENMVRENEDIGDGADEKMLNGNNDAGDKDKLAQKEVEVKFISGEQNGDAKIDIGKGTDTTFTGLSKEELMKFANDPFWIRLRWILFIFFWILWIAMLVGAILIIISAPKCAAPVPLVWWKEGPLVKVKTSDDVELAHKFGAKGVVYELPGDETYLVKEITIENRIKELVEKYNEKNIKLILDITPNYVTKDNPLFKGASENETLRSAFVWVNKGEAPNNWLAIAGGSAWKEVSSQNFVLSQFGKDRYDLQLNDIVAKENFKDVLRHLVSLGVKGFRLANAKHFIIDKSLKDETASNENKNSIHTNYDFWTHAHTTFQDGIAELLHEFTRLVHNATEGDGFLSVSEDIVRPEVFKVNDVLAIDLPQFGIVSRLLEDPISANTAKHLHTELTNVYKYLGESAWPQWQYDTNFFKYISASEFNIFMLLLPGVPIVPLEVFNYHNTSVETIHHLEKYRESPSYMHGNLNIFNDANETLIAYSRLKSGNPGYFVALNPNDVEVVGNFTNTEIASELTVVLLSDYYKVPNVAVKSKIASNAVTLSPRSAIICTFVPK